MDHHISDHSEPEILALAAVPAEHFPILAIAFRTKIPARLPF
jgi:hypothetical protein